MTRTRQQTSFLRHPRIAARKAFDSASKPDGFTMIVTLGVMFVAGILLAAAFTAAGGDIGLTRKNTAQKQAYYAAVAGIQYYEYKLQTNPDYWEKCPEPNGSVKTSEVAAGTYKVKMLAAKSGEKLGITHCETAKPFESVIEKESGAASNSFRIESTGEVEKAKRTLVATFQVTGFLNYVYFTRYETEDPQLYYPESAGCGEKYYSERKSNCTTIQFTEGDSVYGPMHTDDAADVCGEVIFGREGHSDSIEINGGIYHAGCTGKAVFNGTFTEKGAVLIPPQSDQSLESYVESEDLLSGVTHLVLEGTQITETTYTGKKVVLKWPANGLIYVSGVKGQACSIKYEQQNSDTAKEQSEETYCGNVYVSGTYSSPLTIGAANDVIINGNLEPTGVTPPALPSNSSTVTLGLIANEYVRIYHPVEEVCEGGRGGCKTVNASGSLEDPWIYAGILATQHSFLVDNDNVGEPLEELNIVGAIAQNYRGIVGTGGGRSYTGYLKDYKYDERLAVDEPPFFLSPLNSGWKVIRETAPVAG
jgi:type II secretory pathway pseudopilin PulG